MRKGGTLFYAKLLSVTPRRRVLIMPLRQHSQRRTFHKTLIRRRPRATQSLCFDIFRVVIYFPWKLVAKRIGHGKACSRCVGVPELAGDGRHKAGHDGWAAGHDGWPRLPESRSFGRLV